MPNYMKIQQMKLMEKVLYNLLEDYQLALKIMQAIKKNKLYRDIDKIPDLIYSQPNGTFAENLANAPVMDQILVRGTSYQRVYLYTAIAFAYHYVLDCLKPERTEYFDTYLLEQIQKYGRSAQILKELDSETLTNTPRHVVVPYYKDAYLLNSFIYAFPGRFFVDMKGKPDKVKDNCTLYPKILAEGAETFLKNAILSDLGSFRQKQIEKNETFTQLRKTALGFSSVESRQIREGLDKILLHALIYPLLYTALLPDFLDRLFEGKILLKERKQGKRIIYHTETLDISDLLKVDPDFENARWIITTTVTKIIDRPQGNIGIYRFRNPEPEKIDRTIKKQTLASRFSKKENKVFDQAAKLAPLFEPCLTKIETEHCPYEIEITIHKDGHTGKIKNEEMDGLTIKFVLDDNTYALKRKAADAADEKEDNGNIADSDRWDHFFAICNSEITELKKDEEAQTTFESELKEEFEWEYIEDDIESGLDDSGILDLLVNACATSHWTQTDRESAFAILERAYSSAANNDNFRIRTPYRFLPNIGDIPTGMFFMEILYLLVKKKYVNLTSLMQEFVGNKSKDRLRSKDQPKKHTGSTVDAKEEKAEQQHLIPGQSYASQCLEILMLHIAHNCDVSFSDKMYMILILEKIKRIYRQHGMITEVH
jgi:hypothetical protein